MSRNPMLYARKNEQTANFVMAMFEHGAVSFSLSSTETLADIAERVGDINTLHIGAPVAIDVTFNAAAKYRPSRAVPYLGTPEIHW